MATDKVIALSENFDTMTPFECMTFIERSRRQIGKLQAQAVVAKDIEDLANIRRDLDALESDVRGFPAND